MNEGYAHTWHSLGTLVTRLKVKSYPSLHVSSLEKKPGCSTGIQWQPARTLLCRHVCVYCALQITQGEHYRVATDLYSRNVTNVSEVEVLPTSNAPIDQARELRACLYALASLSCIPKALSLKYWPAAEAVVAELRGLPEWSCTLGLGFESWGVVPRSTYSQAQGHRWPLARAGALIPYMYHTWCLRDSDLEKQEVEALVLSAPADYTADLPLHIQLRSRDQGLVSILRTLMSASGTYPHVTVDAADA